MCRAGLNIGLKVGYNKRSAEKLNHHHVLASSRLSGLIESLIRLFTDFELTTASGQSRVPPYLNIHLGDSGNPPGFLHTSLCYAEQQKGPT